MKKYYFSTIVFLTFVSFCFSTSLAHAKLNVVSSTSEIASITKEIGEDKIDVSSIARGYQDPHYIQAKPSFMVKVNRADLLIYRGLELETGWLPLLIEGSRNPKIFPGQPGHLDLSKAIAPLEIPPQEVDRTMGDVHPLGNPHYHLDPYNGILMAQLITEKLASLDPKHAGLFESNHKRFLLRLQAKINEWKNILDKFKGMEVVTYHKTWSYFLNRFGIKSVADIEIRPGIAPSPKHVARVMDMMTRKNIRVILMANFNDSKDANLVAEKTKSRIVSLPESVGGEPEVIDYISLFDFLVSRLHQALNNS